MAILQMRSFRTHLHMKKIGLTNIDRARDLKLRIYATASSMYWPAQGQQVQYWKVNDVLKTCWVFENNYEIFYIFYESIGLFFK